jgi:hypothetical protein
MLSVCSVLCGMFLAVAFHLLQMRVSTCVCVLVTRLHWKEYRNSSIVDEAEGLH